MSSNPVPKNKKVKRGRESEGFKYYSCSKVKSSVQLSSFFGERIIEYICRQCPFKDRPPMFECANSQTLARSNIGHSYSANVRIIYTTAQLHEIAIDMPMFDSPIQTSAL